MNLIKGCLKTWSKGLEQSNLEENYPAFLALESKLFEKNLVVRKFVLLNLKINPLLY